MARIPDGRDHALAATFILLWGCAIVGAATLGAKTEQLIGGRKSPDEGPGLLPGCCGLLVLVAGAVLGSSIRMDRPDHPNDHEGPPI